MIKFRTTVKKLENKTRVARAWRDGDDIKTERESLGWAILLDGSTEWLFVGADKPDLEVGDHVAVTIAREEAG
jgi:hypothetical protein